MVDLEQEDAEPGSTPLSDGKIKASTLVGRMWLVGLAFLQLHRLQAAGAFSVLLKKFNAQTAIRTVAAGVRADESSRRPVRGPSRPDSPRQPRRKTRQELCRRGDAGRQEGGPCRTILRPIKRWERRIDLWTGSARCVIPIIALASAPRSGDDPDRAASRSAFSVCAAVQAHRIFEAGGRHARWRAGWDVRRLYQKRRHQGVRRPL